MLSKSEPRCRRLLATAIPWALVALALAVPAAGQQQAPEAEPDERAGIEEIIVTGSRLERSNLTELGPLTVVGAEDIAVSGASTVDELLRELPAVTFQGITKQNNNGGEGLAQIDLRNAGIERTLVLVNGRRMVVSGTGVSQAPDLNNIPVAMIERVEILLEGASAVYGSDAIGGVVNFILKEDFEGLEIDVYGGTTDRWDGEEGSISATIGTNFDNERGNVTFNITFMNRDEIQQKDRGWSQWPLLVEFFNKDLGLPDPPFPAFGIQELHGSSAVPEGRVGGNFFAPEGGSSFQAFNSFARLGGCTRFDEHPMCDRYNFAQEQWQQGNQQRVSFTMNGHYDIVQELADSWLDDVRFSMEGMFSHRETELQLAPQPLGLSGTGSLPDSFEIAIDNPYIPADFDPVALGVTKPCFLNPTELCFPMARRMTDVGNREWEIDAEFYRVVAALEGEILDRFRWDLFVNWGKTDTNEVINHSINLKRAIVAGDPDLCANEPGCVVANYFGNKALIGGNSFAGTPATPGAIPYIEYKDKEVTVFEELQFGGTIRGDIFELPAGPLQAAIGWEYRDEEGSLDPDAVTVKGEASGNAIQPTDGDYQVYEYFAEAKIPILNEFPGVYELNLDLAWRYTDYDTFGNDDVYRFGLRYAPTADIAFRAIWATAFRAPGIADLFGGTTDSFEVLTDPCNGWGTFPAGTLRDNCEFGGGPFGILPANGPAFAQSASQIRTNIGGNPDLFAETADVWNLGAIFTPTFIPEWFDLSLTLDWYSVEINDAITEPEPQFILTDCFNSSGLSSGNCAAIDRNASGQVSRLDAFAQNIGKVVTRGWDLSLRFGFPLEEFGLPPWGRLDFLLSGNHLTHYDEVGTGGRTSFADTLTIGEGGFFDWQAFGQVTYTSGDWALTNTIRWLNEVDLFSGNTSGEVPPNPLFDPQTKLDEVWYWDVALQYNWRKWIFIVGVNNLLDEDPPVLVGGFGQSSPESYDYVGRFLFSRVTYRF